MSYRLFPMSALLGAIAACVITACGDRAGARPAIFASVDTLPGGIIRTLSTAPSDSGRWSLELLHVIQPPEGAPGELMRPSDVAVMDDGTVLVVEGGPAHVKVFDAGGAYLRSIGRAGAGPGEFRAAWIAARNDSLFVQDPQNARGSTFRVSTGELLLSRSTSCCYYAPIGFDGTGRAVMPAMQSPPDTSRGLAQAYVRAEPGMTAAETVFVYHRRPAPNAFWSIREGNAVRMATPVPLQPRDIQRVDPQGGFITAWTGDYLLRATSDGTDTIAVYGRSFTPDNVSGAEKRAIVDARVTDMRTSNPNGPTEAVLRESFVMDRIPDVRPPFESFAVDPAGRTWVRRSLSDTTIVAFDLFDANRVWLDVVRMPAAIWPSTQWTSVAWGRERVVVPGEDDDGRPLMRVFRIVRAD